MRLFLVALATGAAVAVALPAVTALTTAVADDWIATDRPVQLTQRPAEAKSQAAAKQSKTRGAPPAPMQIEAQAPPVSAQAVSADPANESTSKR